MTNAKNMAEFRRYQLHVRLKPGVDADTVTAGINADFPSQSKIVRAVLDWKEIAGFGHVAVLRGRLPADTLLVQANDPARGAAILRNAGNEVAKVSYVGLSKDATVAADMISRRFASLLQQSSPRVAVYGRAMLHEVGPV